MFRKKTWAGPAERRVGGGAGRDGRFFSVLGLFGGMEFGGKRRSGFGGLGVWSEG